MAEPKTTAVSSHAFSTILPARDSDQLIHETEVAVYPERIHRMSRKDWDNAFSLHWHGDLQ